MKIEAKKIPLLITGTFTGTIFLIIMFFMVIKILFCVGGYYDEKNLVFDKKSGELLYLFTPVDQKIGYWCWSWPPWPLKKWECIEETTNVVPFQNSYDLVDGCLIISSLHTTESEQANLILSAVNDGLPEFRKMQNKILYHRRESD